MADHFLKIVAGPSAFRLIREQGFSPAHVNAVLSAAGGPKWFSIFGLTRYVVHDLLGQTTQDVHGIGSSVGSWQMAAAASPDPGKAMDRLREAYCFYEYSDDPDPQEISDACLSIISDMVGEDAAAIVSNRKKLLHVIAARGKGWLGAESRIKKYAGFGSTAMLNAISRKLLSVTVDRVIFSNSQEPFYHHSEDSLPAHMAPLDSQNLIPALQASGSIPFMMNGVHNPTQAPPGIYWDGGITDYHVTFPFKWTDGIILHPHFGPDVLPGWFDKKLPWPRRASKEYMDRVVLIHPSEEYIRGLPNGRISELKDIKRFGTDQAARMKYWDIISQRSKILGEQLHELVETGRLVDHLEVYH